MKNLLGLLVLFFYTSLNAQIEAKNISIDGINRVYLQYLPLNYQPGNEPLKIMFVLHGLGSTAQNVVSNIAHQIADTTRAIVIYPQALPNLLGQNAWNNGTLLGSSAADKSFIQQIIELKNQEHAINPSKIYCLGISMGAIMAYRLVCEMNSYFAAIGATIGTMSSSSLTDCVPEYKTPIIHIHGTADPTVPYNQNPRPSLSLVPQTMAFWQNIHQCAELADSIRIPDTKNDGMTVDRFIYKNCLSENPLELWRVNGGLHQVWHRSQNDFDSAIESWKFMLRFQHPNPVVLSSQSVALNKPVLFPNPSSTRFQIKNSYDSNVEIMDVNGKKCKHIEQYFGEEIEMGDLEKGIYFIHINQQPPLKFVLQ